MDDDRSSKPILMEIADADLFGILEDDYAEGLHRVSIYGQTVVARTEETPL